MIELPDFSKSFVYENNFYLSCDSTRMSKILAHYELYKMVQDLPGAIVECGVFKGASLARFAMFRDVFGNDYSKKIIGFDIFGPFPETKFELDKKQRKNFIQEAGSESIGTEQLMEVFKHKNIDRNIELIKGDICKTVPKYIKDHPELKISLLNLDTDIYEPSVVILDYLWPCIVKGGILMVDDYGKFVGENKAVDEFFKDENLKILKLPFCMTPSYIVKE